MRERIKSHKRAWGGVLVTREHVKGVERRFYKTARHPELKI